MSSREQRIRKVKRPWEPGEEFTDNAAERYVPKAGIDCPRPRRTKGAAIVSCVACRVLSIRFGFPGGGPLGSDSLFRPFRLERAKGRRPRHPQASPLCTRLPQVPQLRESHRLLTAFCHAIGLFGLVLTHAVADHATSAGAAAVCGAVSGRGLAAVPVMVLRGAEEGGAARRSVADAATETVRGLLQSSPHSWSELGQARCLLHGWSDGAWDDDARLINPSSV